MKTKHRGRLQHPRTLSAIALALACTQAGAQSQPTYSIDVYTITAGGQTLSNGCFRLSGTVAEVAPGYSSDPGYSLYAGFWSAAPASGVDEVFFAGFEGC